NHSLIRCGIGVTTTWSRTAAQMQAQTGIAGLCLRRQRTSTGTHRKNFLDEFDGEINNPPAAEWSKVSSADNGYLARCGEARGRMVNIDLDKRIHLVIAQLHIIGGL